MWVVHAAHGDLALEALTWAQLIPVHGAEGAEDILSKCDEHTVYVMMGAQLIHGAGYTAQSDP